jgi:RNA polymerase sigma-70 factor (ECF subfamily)
MTNDEKIYSTCQSDKEEGFRLLLGTYQRQIYDFIRRMVVVHEDAEDVTQETFLRVFRGLDQYRKECGLGTWIYQIATHECLRFLGKRKSRFLSSDSDSHLTDSLMASDYIDYDDRLAIRFQEAILRLPDKQRVIFNLRYYDELDYQEISRITDTNVAALKADYHYAKEKVKNYMMEE